VILEGHHPNCGNFFEHVIRFHDRKFCAGCAGLIAGAIISLFGNFLYFFYGLQLGESRTLIFWLGFIGVVCGIFQYSVSKFNRSITHLFLNVIFVIGAFFLLVSVYEINGNIAVVFYSLGFIVYLIITRVFLSQIEHKKICAYCGLKCNF
jgi:hypothetical protein